MRRRFLLVLALVTLASGVLVSSAWALRFSDGSYQTPEGEVGTPYGHRFEGVAGSPPYDFKLFRGALPPGLSLNSDGQVSGTPTASGSFSFWVELSDTFCGPTKPTSPCAQREFTINIAPDLRITTEAAPGGTTGQPYGLQLAWVGGGTIKWSISAGALPPGFTLDQNGVLQGTPAAPGDYDFTVFITDGKRSDTKRLTLRIRDRLAFVPPLVVPLAEVGAELRQPIQLAATGGSQKYTFEVVTLPGGLTLDTEGKILGTPRVAGTFPIPVVVKDDEGRSVTGELQLTIARKLKIVTRRMPQAKIGNPFRAEFRVRGGVEPLRWKAVAGEGRFPHGVRLNKKLGFLVGKPRRVGRYQFTIEARDRLGVVATRTLTIVVKPKPKSKG